MANLILLTGFGPFRAITDNPSGRVVEAVTERLTRSGRFPDFALESRVLPVEPGTIRSVELARYHLVISLGVAASASTLRVERVARNLYRETSQSPPVAIDPELALGTPVRGGPLPPDITRPVAALRVRLGGPESAGDYVCNDTFFRVCRALGERRISLPNTPESTHPGRAYFIHLPNLPKNQDGGLIAGLTRLIARILDNDSLRRSSTQAVAR